MTGIKVLRSPAEGFGGHLHDALPVEWAAGIDQEQKLNPPNLNHTILILRFPSPVFFRYPSGLAQVFTSKSPTDGCSWLVGSSLESE